MAKKIRLKTKPAGQMPLDGMELIESAPRKQPPVDEAWDAFWSAYPRKVDKYGARMMWDKLMKDRDVKVEEILLGLRAQLPVLALNGPFVPHPVTWLRHRRWHDRLADISPQPPTQAEKLYAAALDRYLREGKV
jgi:hypothetical protein